MSIPSRLWQRGPAALLAAEAAVSTRVLAGCVCLLTDFECAFAVRPCPGGCVLCWLPVGAVWSCSESCVRGWCGCVVSFPSGRLLRVEPLACMTGTCLTF